MPRHHIEFKGSHGTSLGNRITNFRDTIRQGYRIVDLARDIDATISSELKAQKTYPTSADTLSDLETNKQGLYPEPYHIHNIVAALSTKHKEHFTREDFISFIVDYLQLTEYINKLVQKDVIVLLIPRENRASFFWTDVEDEITRYIAAKHSYYICVSYHHEDDYARTRHYLELLAEMPRLAAVIYAPVCCGDFPEGSPEPARYEALIERVLHQAPMVFVDREMHPQPTRGVHVFLGPENEKIGYACARHLLQAGCRYIYGLFEEERIIPSALRHAGFLRAITDANDRDHLDVAGRAFVADKHIPTEFRDFQSNAKELLDDLVNNRWKRGLRDRVGVVCINSFSAYILYKEIDQRNAQLDPDDKELEIKPGINLAIICCDAAKQLEEYTPKITSTAYSPSSLATAAVDAAIELTRKNPTTKKIEMKDYSEINEDPKNNSVRLNLH